MKPAFLIPVFLIAFTVFSTAQPTDTEATQKATVRTLVSGNRYTFEAESVSPMKGGLKNLSSGYTLKVDKDTIISDLPYFGRAYNAPISSDDAGIKFISVDFEYKVTEKKKGEWDIVIKPKDTKDVRELALTVFDNGNASLYVNSNNRQPISFNGYIRQRRLKNK